MILFTLKCHSDHTFEAWFKDGATYERQARAGTIACPQCGDSRVEKAPMAPRLAKSAPASDAAELRRALQLLRKHVETHCDHVGDRFAEEARKIHYGESPARGIYGEASAEEARQLADEGVAFGRIPWVPTSDA